MHIRTMKIPVVIPARNEEKRLEKTIQSIRETSKFAGVEPYIVVVDDGSKDKTGDVARQLGCEVIRLRDRGYSALGRPELADTHNAGFEHIASKKDLPYEFIMVSGSDTSYATDYLKILLDHMHKNQNLAMCSGVLDGFYTNPMAVRGSGRIIRRSFWDSIGGKLPNDLYAWESFPVVAANTRGLKTSTIYEARMQTDRPPLRSVDWKRYGIGMKENGSVLAYVVLRGAKASFQISPKAGFRLILGYFSSVKNRYPLEMRQFVSSYQKNRILSFFGIKR
jgi:glycosyltransferase involved in cell wall biosynthesis